MKKKTGQPVSNEERRSRPLRHLILYGLKMGLTATTGGRRLGEQSEFFAAQLVGQTARRGGELTVAAIQKALDGITERQRRTIEEIERRQDKLAEAAYKLSVAGGSLDPLSQALLDAAAEMLYGEGGSPPPQPETIDSHVLQ